jgi:3-oxoacyl-[acyl-carrier protein] reductase
MTKAPPLERHGAADDIARGVSFLVSEDGGWANGQTVRANREIV